MCPAGHVTPEEGRRTHRPKGCETKNEDENNCPSIVNEKNYQVRMIKKNLFHL